MADTRIFRLTRERQEGHETEYVSRQAAGQRWAHSRSYRGGRVIRVDATDKDATSGWTEVTEEFRKRNP